jgi:hypothetical protein
MVLITFPSMRNHWAQHRHRRRPVRAGKGMRRGVGEADRVGELLVEGCPVQPVAQPVQAGPWR